MRRIAVYGKVGIGKSTTVANLSAACAEAGLRVLQVGCDPKADSTVLLRDQASLATILDRLRAGGGSCPLGEVTATGFRGVVLAESGGPVPGSGCAGRGVAAALEYLDRAGAYQAFRTDVAFYDVLGDVVCGGFAMPMRRGFADKVAVLTSGERMSLYAAANIAMAVRKYEDRGNAGLAGFILVRRGVEDEEAEAGRLARDFAAPVLGALDWSREVQEAEKLGKTVIEAFPDGAMAAQYRALGKALLAALGDAGAGL
ncbi:MAG: AAA family ATPase [Desulfovibrio sp.]|nr:AAA family ATPase [Desulfovibrio sp.]